MTYQEFLQIVMYEDNHLLVVNKPSGMLVQGDQTGDTPLSEHAKQYIAQKYNKPGAVFCGTPHRIDRPVSGIVVLARTSKALERMSKMFQNREVDKTYWAITEKRPPKTEDTITHWLKKDTNKNFTHAYSSDNKGGLKSVLEYKLISAMGDRNLIEIKPITGRPHQIRVQLAKIGCPIIGDVKYGFPKPTKDGSIALHARAISFEHPTKKEPLNVVSPIPKAFVWSHFEGII
ncbi:RNA pseudouridine synthase [Marivirga lumbricoides]|uniref:RNA pseudouridine synthase n=1 Tax=Marivirga lumbricoides TaxID=1046115 RepID=A0A2T4DQD4_9BACT|nr:RNA pseudouridine synthase [Marivirga lumbricoides]GGC38379.1 RNA pseudouridine synthase [Marivirga lumbricoides]